MNFSTRANIIYGSQTGTAYDVSTWLRNKLSSQFISVDCWEGNNFTETQRFLPGDICIYILSTAGNGDAPINFRKHWEYIFSNACSASIETIKFAVFGLGDSKYPQFNYPARMLYGRLKHGGGEPICQLGCGDDQHTLGYSQELVPWVGKLWEALFGSAMPLTPTVHPCRITVNHSDREDRVARLHHVRVASNCRMTSTEHFQDVRHLKLDVLGNWSFQAGDVLTVLPQATPEVASHFIESVLKDDPLRRVEVRESDGPQCGVFSLRELFTDILDVSALPTHFFYEVLFHSYMQQLGEVLLPEQMLIRDKLAQLAAFSAEGAFERLRYSTKERMSVGEVLEDFYMVRVPLDRLVEAIPRIAPRYYSLCNNAKSCAVLVSGFPILRVPVTRAEICVAVADFTTLFGRRRRGLASEYLKGLSVGTVKSGRMWLERGFSGNLRTQLDSAEAAILVGPGTGIAPIRAILSEYKNRKDFFLVLSGFRNPQADFLFQSDLFNKPNTIVAWSRPDRMDRSLGFSWSQIGAGGVDLGTGSLAGRKTWVSDLVGLHANAVENILKKKKSPLIIICGRSHPMPTQVISAMEAVVGVERMNELIRAGRIVFDTWG